MPNQQATVTPPSMRRYPGERGPFELVVCERSVHGAGKDGIAELFEDERESGVAPWGDLNENQKLVFSCRLLMEVPVVWSYVIQRLQSSCFNQVLGLPR